MRKILCLFLSFILLSGCSGDNKTPLPQIKGKWVVVNYWAAWCSSCIQEIPELNRFHQSNIGNNIEVYGINYDSLSSTDLKNAIHQAKITFPVLETDPSHIWKLSEVETLPTTFIISPSGKIEKKLVGPTTEKKLAQTIAELQKKA